MSPGKCRDTIDVLPHLKQLYPEIQRFSFDTYRKRPHVEERAVGWERGENLEHVFLRSPHGPLFGFRRDEFTKRILRNQAEALPLHYCLNVYSRVEVADGLAYIPLLDLRGGDNTPQRAKTVEQLLRCPEINQSSGFLLDSGNGLHFIGTQLIRSDSELV